MKITMRSQQGAIILLLATSTFAFQSPLNTKNQKVGVAPISGNTPYWILKTTSPDIGFSSAGAIARSPTELFSSHVNASKNLDKSESKIKLSATVVTGDEMLNKEAQSVDDNGEVNIWTARALLLLVAILWGTNFASVKYLEQLCFNPPCNHLPSEAALARFGVAGLAGLPFLFNKRKDVILAGFECGALITLGYITQAIALSDIPASRCAFICSLTVVVVPFISAVFEGKPIKASDIISAVLAICGVGILEGFVDFGGEILPTMTSSSAPHVMSHVTTIAESSTQAASSNSSFLFGISKGDIIALGQPFGFGLAFMRIEHYVDKFKDVKDRILTITGAQCIAVFLMSLGWVLHDFHGRIPDMSYMMEPHRLAAVLWTGIITTVVAIYIEGFALQKASATEAAITFSSEPVWASLFGAWLLQEHLDINSYVGGAVIMGACLLGALGDMFFKGQKD